MTPARRRFRPVFGLLVAVLVLGLLDPDSRAALRGFRISPDGLRVPAVEAPADAPLVVTLGGSSIFGDGVDDGDTIHDVMAAALRDAGCPTRVRTLALPGYSTLQTRILLDEIGWAMDPHLLVLGNPGFLDGV